MKSYKQHTGKRIRLLVFGVALTAVTSSGAVQTQKAAEDPALAPLPATPTIHCTISKPCKHSGKQVELKRKDAVALAILAGLSVRR